MRKTIAVVIAVGLVGGALLAAPAEAKKRKKKPVRVERTIEIAYTHPGIGAGTPVGATGYPANFPESILDDGEIALGAEDLYISIEVIDASGYPVTGFISQGDIDGNGVNDDGYATFCGKHPMPQAIMAPGEPIIGIYAYGGTCVDGTQALMTSGTIKVTLSNMP